MQVSAIPQRATLQLRRTLWSTISYSLALVVVLGFFSYLLVTTDYHTGVLFLAGGPIVLLVLPIWRQLTYTMWTDDQFVCQQGALVGRRRIPFGQITHIELESRPARISLGRAAQHVAIYANDQFAPMEVSPGFFQKADIVRLLETVASQRPDLTLPRLQDVS
jgi:hypothetical protein